MTDKKNIKEYNGPVNDLYARMNEFFPKDKTEDYFRENPEVVMDLLVKILSAIHSDGYTDGVQEIVRQARSKISKSALSDYDEFVGFFNHAVEKGHTKGFETSSDGVILNAFLDKSSVFYLAGSHGPDSDTFHSAQILFIHFLVGLELRKIGGLISKLRPDNNNAIFPHLIRIADLASEIGFLHRDEWWKVNHEDAARDYYSLAEQRERGSQKGAKTTQDKASAMRSACLGYVALDLSRFSSALGSHLSGLSFKSQWAFPT